ncbi:YiiX family permuted papain-like enzyme [Pseudomonas tohonis]|uniref:YiiX family permuted papain-like enzyme n=1 Tax=Pseudomonas tohonis TaxID=2725477 RepID=UPI0021D8CAF2|nr:YiiX family permuted papain-like enzyme [Pseudomonas tohonis]UXY53944.1 YiiX family permuted papain-like enzyme [Pseudomonas tohonis]
MRFSLFLISSLFACLAQAAPLPEVHEGDIIFHQSRSAQSLAVQQATHSRYSHMGLVLARNGTLQVFEAGATVQYVPLQHWIARGEGGHYVVKRLAHADELLTHDALVRMRQLAEGMRGRRYDLAFEWNDQRLYCSELVWKLYERTLGLRLGELQRIRDFDLGSPVVKAKMRERYGQEVPLDETVISPVAIFESPQLITVAEE